MCPGWLQACKDGGKLSHYTGLALDGCCPPEVLPQPQPPTRAIKPAVHARSAGEDGLAEDEAACEACANQANSDIGQACRGHTGPAESTNMCLPCTQSAKISVSTHATQVSPTHRCMPALGWCPAAWASPAGLRQCPCSCRSRPAGTGPAAAGVCRGVGRSRRTLAMRRGSWLAEQLACGCSGHFPKTLSSRQGRQHTWRSHPVPAWAPVLALPTCCSAAPRCRRASEPPGMSNRPHSVQKGPVVACGGQKCRRNGAVVSLVI